MKKILLIKIWKKATVILLLFNVKLSIKDYPYIFKNISSDSLKSFFDKENIKITEEEINFTIEPLSSKIFSDENL